MSINRRGFLNMLRGESGKSRTDEQPKMGIGEKKGITRRGFLTEAAKVTAAVSAGLVLSGPAESFAKAVFGDENDNEIKEAGLKKEERESAKEFEDFINDVYQFVIDNIKDCTLDEKEKARSKFLREYKAIFEEKMLAGVKADQLFYSKRKSFSAKLDYLFGSLNYIGCVGLAVGFFKRNNLLCPELEKKLTQRKDYYGIHVVDYLPDENSVGLNEIDPRYNVLENDDFSQNTKDVVSENIGEKRSWSSMERWTGFLSVFSNEKLRKTFVDNNLLLCEAYSLTKAIIRFIENSKDCKLTDEEILERLLVERQVVMDREILGSNTDSFILFNYYEEAYPNKFDGNALERIAEFSGVNYKKIHRIDGKSADEPKKDLGAAICDSRGNTTIFFNTHGLGERIRIRDEEFLNISDLAINLLFRLKDTKDKDELGKINILLASCYGYDFAINLVKKIKEIYEKGKINIGDGYSTWAELIGHDFSEITMPTIITIAEEGSLGFTGDNAITNTLYDYKETLQKEGGVTGKVLMKRVQSEAYVHQDMTFFSGQPGGILEVANLDLDSFNVDSPNQAEKITA